MSMRDVEYVSIEQAATELGLSERTIRWYCEQYDWFGGRCGKGWVLTRDEVDKMKTFPRPSAGRPKRVALAGVGVVV